MKPVEVFEQHRRHLFTMAYRMLGSAAEAEDVVQDAWLRFQEADTSAVTSARAWLSTVVTRLCLDERKSARARREVYVGPWLPEPIATGGDDVDRESISMAFLVLLESLSPVERAVYLLHEVFDYSHAEVASMVGREEAACRQVFHRARERVIERRPRFAASREQHGAILGGFLEAIGRGDLQRLCGLLAADVVSYSDGGGKARAALRPVLGDDAVARLLIGLTRKQPADRAAIDLLELNGWPAMVVREGERARVALLIETDGERVVNVFMVLNPEKLSRL